MVCELRGIVRNFLQTAGWGKYEVRNLLRYLMRMYLLFLPDAAAFVFRPLSGMDVREGRVA